MDVAELGQWAVRLSQGYTANERNGLGWNGKGTTAVTEK